ncbi:hypothetical protein QNI19_20225 [Cytophagaceae bacterium DM2B3-1]|uniref:Uncharacterized protein n=1 Tax=Xanthocytophaga flava TaxID=3048013 RepID=A0ABT7CNG4_9BACT|nr:hypothetical protein [Xanthocytophaga flavus]MDJ1467201.1 hypothetical protein [Xanthocytophaga flavus]MDJ1495278.1 hypothetical protein [Xanthocytophaga flavus]
MPRYHTNTTAIRKYKSEYYGLLVYEARLNYQLFRMAQRIKAIQKDEEQSLANQALLTSLLAHTTQQKAELEAKPASKERDKQLKKAEKEYKEANASYKRNEYHLAVLEKKKDKDNAAKYVLKEMKRDQVRIRIKAAYDIWKKLEQAEQYEFMDFELFKALHFVKQTQKVSTQIIPSLQTEQISEKPLSLNDTSSLTLKNVSRITFQMYSRPQNTNNLLTRSEQSFTETRSHSYCEAQMPVQYQSNKSLPVILSTISFSITV